MYAQKRTVFTWLAKQLFEPLNDLARIRGQADVWSHTRGCHHCGQTTWKMGPHCCFCGGDQDTPHMARAVGGSRPCCRVCQSAPLPPLPLPQQAATLQQDRRVGKIETYTGIHKAASQQHKMPAKVFLEESTLPQFSGKLPTVERDTPPPGAIKKYWNYESDEGDTQPRRIVEQAGE